MEDKRNAILVICGPTASGKTRLAVEISKRINGEVISADSMQIYEGLDVGTAKPTSDEMQGIAHHLMGFAKADIRFSVADYVKLANGKINDIILQGKNAVICGGTGQYISSLTDGLSFIGAKADTTLRDRLWEREKNEGIEKLYKELVEVDPEYAKSLHINNKGRILRALELYLQTGKTMTQQREESVPPQRPYNDLIIGLNFANRELLYDKINARVDIMLNNGLLKEARYVYDNREAFVTASQAIGYKELFPYFNQADSLESCVDKLKQASRNYAKRQLTWFKKMKEIIWLDAQSENLTKQAAELWERHNEQRQ